MTPTRNILDHPDRIQPGPPGPWTADEIDALYASNFHVVAPNSDVCPFCNARPRNVGDRTCGSQQCKEAGTCPTP